MDATNATDTNEAKNTGARTAHRNGQKSPRGLNRYEKRIALAACEAAFPSGTRLPSGGPETVRLLENFIATDPAYRQATRAALWATEMSSLPSYGRPFSSLSPEKRERVLTKWSESRFRLVRESLRGVMAPLRAAYFENPAIRELLGLHQITPPATVEEPRWLRQMTDGRQVDEDLDLECEVVVVGSGAGGAAAAYELARRGRAVLMVESGHYFDRRSFDGDPLKAFSKLYLGRGMTLALGNLGVPVWAGRAVGGTTIVNSGTCYRTPEWTLKRWADDFGLSMLSSAHLDPYFRGVEEMLQIGPAQDRYLGGAARVIARGAEKLGLAHGPLPRNAPSCDGQGVCAFGCPTGAKRSTDVSYIPAALEHGAQLISGAHVSKVEIVAGRARGVRGRLASGRTFRIRADAVVVAGGTLMTPLLLRKSGACVSSGWLGKNLSIHPAAHVIARFDEDIDMSRGIPQSYGIDTFAPEGIMYEGGSLSLKSIGGTMPFAGRRYMDFMDQYRKTALFGFMIQDKSRGEVRQGPKGMPLITYNLCKEDVAQMHKGLIKLCEVYLEAGAEHIWPGVTTCDEVVGRAGIESFRSMRLKASHIESAAFHPLGTCRLGTDPKTSCVGPDHQAHDTAALYVTDGSAVPSSLGANPQVTIMALASRAAEIIDGRLD